MIKTVKIIWLINNSKHLLISGNSKNNILKKVTVRSKVSSKLLDIVTLFGQARFLIKLLLYMCMLMSKLYFYGQ